MSRAKGVFARVRKMANICQIPKANRTMPMPMPTDLLVLLFWSGSAQEGHDLGEHEQSKAASQSVRPSVRQLLSQPGVYRIWLYYIYCCDLIDCCHADGKESLARVAAAGLGAAAAAWLPRHTESAPRDAILNFAHLLLAHVFCCRI